MWTVVEDDSFLYSVMHCLNSMHLLSCMVIISYRNKVHINSNALYTLIIISYRCIINHPFHLINHDYFYTSFSKQILLNGK